MERLRITRRAVLAGTAATLATPSIVRGQAAARVVVIGAGFGGASAAKYVKAWAPAAQVTVIEPSERFITCPYSNLVLGGLRDMASITHSYDKLAQRVTLVRDSAVAIDADCAHGAAAGRHRGAVRPADRVARHRLPLGRDRRLRRGGGREDAACLEGRAADRAAAPAARGDARRRHRDHRRARQSVPLPARAVRAHLDDRALPQDREAEVEADRARRQGHVLQAGAVPRRLEALLSRRSSSGCRCRRAARSSRSTRLR